MAEIRGLVVKKQGERAEIKVDKTESELTGLPKYLDCWNPVGAKAGDVVGAEYRDFDNTKAWYNGYLINGMHMYNPNSVYQSMLDEELKSYWRFGWRCLWQ